MVLIPRRGNARRALNTRASNMPDHLSVANDAASTIVCGNYYSLTVNKRARPSRSRIFTRSDAYSFLFFLTIPRIVKRRVTSFGCVSSALFRRRNSTISRSCYY